MCEDAEGPSGVPDASRTAASIVWIPGAHGCGTCTSSEPLPERAASTPLIRTESTLPCPSSPSVSLTRTLTTTPAPCANTLPGRGDSIVASSAPVSSPSAPAENPPRLSMMQSASHASDIPAASCAFPECVNDEPNRSEG
eukprot:CAMPEP_0180275504 /NCGR_PEP_ID=MMETSP0988-20121125/5876_1 /TAXON_ID=697907 /ORGANISM="non described non described, Strain CCMP2293" /LENGTH=139 /DNA_ID=CAMNT_0022246771 /DNA_START=122 /DNA_END=537 /DNA_ORIENTATION=-